MFDEAQAIAAAHRTVGDGPGTAQPFARHDYALRSRIRCRLCQRRMCGITRTSSRYYTAGQDALHTYYLLLPVTPHGDAATLLLNRTGTEIPLPV